MWSIRSSVVRCVIQGRSSSSASRRFVIVGVPRWWASITTRSIATSWEYRRASYPDFAIGESYNGRALATRRRQDTRLYVGDGRASGDQDAGRLWRDDRAYRVADADRYRAHVGAVSRQSNRSRRFGPV